MLGELCSLNCKIYPRIEILPASVLATYTFSLLELNVIPVRLLSLSNISIVSITVLRSPSITETVPFIEFVT